MSKLAIENSKDRYELTGNDTKIGLAVLTFVVLCGVFTSWSLFEQGYIKNSAVVGTVCLLLGALDVYGLKRLRAKIVFWFTDSEIFKEENGLTERHRLSDILSIKLTCIGAGETSAGSYKVTLNDGIVYWFHGFGRSERFVKNLAMTANISIFEV